MASGLIALLDDVAALDLYESPDTAAGIYQNHPLLGATAADQLISQLQRGDFGVPEQPISLLVSGV